MSYISTIAIDKMTEMFQSKLPSSLYLDHYELASTFGGTSQAWSTFLKDPETKRFIEREIASIAEASARKALSQLSGNDSITSQQVSAIKEILNKSQLIQQKSQSKATVILTYLPQKQ